MSSSASSRDPSRKPQAVRPATDDTIKELFDEYEFKHVATWETPLKYKAVYETSKYISFFCQAQSQVQVLVQSVKSKV